MHHSIVSLAEISKGESWSGRVCCPLPQSETCKRACVTATTSADLMQGCRQSDEISFYGCLERQQQGEECCGQAITDECRGACLDIFRSYSSIPSKQQRSTVAEHCEHSNPKVYACVRNLTKVTPATNLHKREFVSSFMVKFRNVKFRSHQDP